MLARKNKISSYIKFTMKRKILAVLSSMQKIMQLQKMAKHIYIVAAYLRYLYSL